MAWTKHFTPVKVNSYATQNSAFVAGSGSSAPGTSANFASYLPEVYCGHPNRIQRYFQYMEMDRDSDINAALDTIADFCTQSEEQTDEPFKVKYSDNITDTEMRLIRTSMTNWVKQNKFKSRLWQIFRNTIQNGDSFFLRDPENGEWLWVDHLSVEMVKVDDSAGKKADEYIIRGLDYGKQDKFATGVADPSNYRSPYGTAPGGMGRPAAPQTSSNNVFAMSNAMDNRHRGPNSSTSDQLFVVDAENVVHLSLSTGMDVNWPFGTSILEPIFKTFKQKELLEDSIIIYRVQRAPERRIFYIDVGNMNQVKAKAHIEQIKTEMHQRRIPNRTGGGSSILDAAYNPLSVMEDYYFAQSAEGRGSKVETLPGGDQVGEITDLLFFARKLARGLRIPTSYLNLGDNEGSGVAYNDGKLGQALVEEFRFNKYCMRFQSLLAPIFDADFKRYLTKSGIEIEPEKFEVEFNPPQNFTKYRQAEMDAAQVGVYQMVADNKKLSERFKQGRFLGLTPDEILENERLWREENASKLKKVTGSTPAEDSPEGGLSDVGVSPGGGGDMGFDLDAAPEAPPEGEGGPMPPDAGSGGGGTPSPAGGGAPPPPMPPG